MLVKAVFGMVSYGRVAADVVGHGDFEFLEFLIRHKVLKPGQDLLVELYLGLVLLGTRNYYRWLLFSIALREIFLFHRTSL